MSKAKPLTNEEWNREGDVFYLPEFDPTSLEQDHIRCKCGCESFRLFYREWALWADCDACHQRQAVYEG